jgi:hypothetical protein
MASTPRIRTVDFLPEIFQTPTNKQFLSATLDQLVAQPKLEKIQGYIGNKYLYKDVVNSYVPEPTKTRDDYQLDPAVTFLKPNTAAAQDFICYPGIIDALQIEGGYTDDNAELFTSQFYSWDSFTNLDKIINFNQYYWLRNGPPVVSVTTDAVNNVGAYIVTSEANDYSIVVKGQTETLPTFTFLRGGTYTFTVDQTSQFWIQGVPGLTGMSATAPLIQTRDVLGVTNNGATVGTVTFTVPLQSAQSQYIFPGNNPVDLVSTSTFAALNGAVNTTLIDGVTPVDGLTLMFFNGIADSNFYTIDLGTSPGFITLTATATIPTSQNIVANYGDTYGGITFYRNSAGVVDQIPYLSSLLDTLYYQDGTSSLKVGTIKLVDSNILNPLNIDDIIGQKTFTSPNGVVFTNGLKVMFSGDIIPSSYIGVEYYVEGVGTAIELIKVVALDNPEAFAGPLFLPWGIFPWDTQVWDSTTYSQVEPDYLTIARNSVNKNAWSRSNRWFHKDVITVAATYNNDPTLITTYATAADKAKRPIIEFYPNLKLFNSGSLPAPAVDFIDFRTTNPNITVVNQPAYYPDVKIWTAYTATIAGCVSSFSTTVTVVNTDIFTISGNPTVVPFTIGQFVSDSNNKLSIIAQITAVDITTTPGTTILTVGWDTAQTIPFTTGVSLVADEINNNNYSLFDGAKVLFANSTDSIAKNKIYVVSLSKLTGATTKTITLSELSTGALIAEQQTFALRGYNYQGKNFYYTGTHWNEAQEKKTVNQAPLFDVMDSNGISFSDTTIYHSSTFDGSKLFAYTIGIGPNDTVLGFPLSYSSLSNLGDINFTVSFNTDMFTYTENSVQVSEHVNLGYVYNFTGTENVRQLGWQTAIAPSVQYQLFNFNYYADNPTDVYICDIAQTPRPTNSWPTIVVLVNNAVQEDTLYTVTVTDAQTTIVFAVPNPLIDTIVQIMLVSNQISNTAYYGIPINLVNNPLNNEIEHVNVADIRGQYTSIFYNNPEITGTLYGSNNFRDLGNLVPWGNKIIQNSASLVLAGAFLRKQNHNLFNALKFNSKEYISYKTYLIDTVNSTGYSAYQTPAEMLNAAVDKISSAKTQGNSFFWSDMLPARAASSSNSYIYATLQSISIYPLSMIYNFKTANYNGVLLYRKTTVDGIDYTTQLTRGVDYTVSDVSPTVIVTKQLTPGDLVTINEYSQTFGSYVPNTPTKLGLYPSSIPCVVLDESYAPPTYFIVGHDGSYNKLYGNYNPVTNKLVDFRDQVLLEFEQRIYNNLKLSSVIPISEYDVMPGFFRDTGYTYDQVLSIYSINFLNWVGQNRIDYQQQFYNSEDEFTYNYRISGNKINNSPIEQGYWRGVYQYFYDTAAPDTSPWEMLGFTDEPNWWTAHYGAAPYTSDNLILWGDLAAGINWNNGNPIVIPSAIRPGLLTVLPVDSAGNLVSPFVSIVGNYWGATFKNSWKVGDVGPAEASYRKSSSWPFDLMRILALTRPAQFFNLGADLDDYRYNSEFNQYLVNNRSHLRVSDIAIYGSGTPKTSYINWIVDFEKQSGIDATAEITSLLNNIDVRLVYRLAGFSDKNMLRFYAENGSATSSTSGSLLIPDDNYKILLYDNQPFDTLVYSSVIVQITSTGYSIYGNSQTSAYFKTIVPAINGEYKSINVDKATVKIASNYSDTVVVVPYGTQFYNLQDLSQFIMSYGKYLESQGMVFAQIENGLEVNWPQMVAEFLYWAQMGWQIGSILNINPAATLLVVDKDSHIVQPLTLREQNFVLNQNLYPIQAVDLLVTRQGTLFSAAPQNSGDTIAYGKFNLSNIEHAIVFDNITQFNDLIYDTTTGLRQSNMSIIGSRSAEWNGTVDAQGFVLNQDNIIEWSRNYKYPAGSLVTYKNKYWSAITLVQAKEIFDEREWKETDGKEILGLLPNSSTRSYESTLYYDVNRANLENDADLLSFSLIGYRPRDYMALADLSDITQINVYKNMIKNKGTLNSVSAFKGALLAQGGVQYDIYENWAIKTGEFGGVLNSNFVEFRINEALMTGNPSTVMLYSGVLSATAGIDQSVNITTLTNYARPVTNPNILPTTISTNPSTIYPTAGYANFNDVKMSSYYYNGMAVATDAVGIIVPIDQLYVRDYIWLADYMGTWQIFTPVSMGQVYEARNNLNGTVTLSFAKPHGMTQYQAFAVVNFSQNINGYYIAMAIVDPYRIMITLTLPPAIIVVTGVGVGMLFQSQRVDKPSDIINLPLLNSEFVKNTVWVDEGSDSSWAVYRKSINYLYNAETLKSGSVTFGSAVAYSSLFGYLFADPGIGSVYRYLTASPTVISQTLTQGVSFGSTITYAGGTVVISEPGPGNVYVYNYDLATDSLLLVQTITGVPCDALAISGDKNWLYITDITSNAVYAEWLNPATGQYMSSATITEPTVTPGDNFGHSISTNYYGDTLFISAPNQDNGAITDCGYSYVFERTVQNFEAQTTGIPTSQLTFNLSWTPTITTTVYVNGVALASNDYTIVAAALTLPVSIYIAGSFAIALTYTIVSVGSTDFTLIGATSNTIGTIFTATGVGSGTGTAALTIRIGDIVNVSGDNFVLAQTLTTGTTPRVGTQFGQSLDTTRLGEELIVGAPYELTGNSEGAAYRFTNGGQKYGRIIGTSVCNITTNADILLNGYVVSLISGMNAAAVAAAILAAGITNVTAYATTTNMLVISLENFTIPSLILTVLDSATCSEIGVALYTPTQVIVCPHSATTTAFGYTVKFNEFASVVISAPTATRYTATTFDFTDDELDNDTVFDNNTTQWRDADRNAGAVYMFDYLSVYAESLSNLGNFVYAQSVNAQNSVYGAQPYYGQQLDYNNSRVVVGTPLFIPGVNNGQVVTYISTAATQDWAVYRSSCAVVDTSRIGPIQIFSAESNQTLVNLDYMDPLQGKLLGIARENIDIVSNVDPAGYNASQKTGAMIWGDQQIGTLWFDTSSVRFVNYHQNDVTYNSIYWGKVFPNSDVAVYSWIVSNSPPITYTGPGTVYDIAQYSVESIINASNELAPVYFFWVRNTNVIFTKTGKTLSDFNVQTYISSPQLSGVSYFAPLQPNIFALYTAEKYINAQDSVLHIGYQTGTNDDVAHSSYELIRSNYADDFLTGLPTTNQYNTPYALYERMLSSLSGWSSIGIQVPNPLLPREVKLGILSRPSQSFFTNQKLALQNYLQYANAVVVQYPIVELKQMPFLAVVGPIDPVTGLHTYDTSIWWEYTNWWATGYDDSTTSAARVSVYADLATLIVPSGTIVTVNANGGGTEETYILLTDNTWSRIGLANGTIRFLSSIWSTSSTYPTMSEPIRNIVRSLNEEIYTNELLVERNRSLIMLFDYIQSETIETQNYLPWLNKTSFIDVSHVVRDLQPLKSLRSDNQEFLAGYITEVKPFHVVIKDFLFKYTKSDIYGLTATDFDLPSRYNSTYEQFITPELIYTDTATNISQYVAGSPIWQEPEYVNWFNNRGLTIAGIPAYGISTLKSYMLLNTSYIIVDNPYGFPSNGVVTIDAEQIGYSVVNKTTSTLSGLTRGANFTTIAYHLPGSLISIDLPGVVVLDAGRKYKNPPIVTAYIDTTMYPVPTVAAILKPIMSGDTILRIQVVNPGKGYAVLPTILIEPSLVIAFTADQVSITNNVIELYNTDLITGDLVRYSVDSLTTKVGGLQDNQFYYVNVLETDPTFIIALYTSQNDAINDTYRVQLISVGSGVNNMLSLSAYSSCVTNAQPIRENKITLKYDRISYGSNVVNWVPSKYYGSLYAGDIQKEASSSVQLQSIQPTIYDIFASAQLATFKITGTAGLSVIEWSSRLREVVATVVGTNAITIAAVTDGSLVTTVGFTPGMPVRFAAPIGSFAATTYYVRTVIDSYNFTVSSYLGGGDVTTTSATGSVILYTGSNPNTSVVTIDYPGQLLVTSTNTVIPGNPVTNTLTIPGGTQDFFENMQVFFTGTVFGGVVPHRIYYVNSVINSTTISIASRQVTPVAATITTAGSNLVTIASATAANFAVNDAVIFTNMTIDSVAVSSIGNIVAGMQYYILTIVDNNSIILSTAATSIKAGSFVPTTVYTIASIGTTDFTLLGAASNTIGITFTCTGVGTGTGTAGIAFSLVTAAGVMTITDQQKAFVLTTATGSMKITAGDPIAPGQLTTQKVNFAKTSGTFNNVAGVVSNMLSRQVVYASSFYDYLYLSQFTAGAAYMYANMPFMLAGTYAGLSAGTVYYVANVSTVTTTVTGTHATGNILTGMSTSGFYVGMLVNLGGISMGGLDLGRNYYILSIVNSTDFIITEIPGGNATDVTGTSSSTNEVALVSAVDFAVDDPVVFSDIIISGLPSTTLGNLVLGTQYYVLSVSSTGITVSLAVGGGVVVLTSVAGTAVATQNIVTVVTDGSGAMTLTGPGYMQVSATLGGPVIPLTESTNTIYLTQYVTSPPLYAVGYQLGGYTMVVPEGSGYAETNTITILGNLIGGSTPDNDFVLNVNSVNSTGAITTFISSSTPVRTENAYYVKVIDDNSLSVYYDEAMILPVNFDDFIYTANDYVYLPAPAQFIPSIVVYNKRAYECLVSNNDDIFVLRKWKLLQSSDKQLNAADRIMLYYSPTVDMPGKDLSQLMTGISYPNTAYRGNSFAPIDEYIIDTNLVTVPFASTNIAIQAVIWNGTKYIAVANAPTYSCIMTSNDGIEWLISRLSEQPIAMTDISYSPGSKYVITTQNQTTPLLTSPDSIVWTSSPTVTVAPVGLNAVAYVNGIYVAAGNDVVVSTDAATWTTTISAYTGTFISVGGVFVTDFTGFIAVGKVTDTVSAVISVMQTSIDGVTWSTPSVPTTNTLNAVADSDTTLVAVGDNGVKYYSSDAINWTLAPSSIYTNKLNDIIYSRRLTLFVTVGNNGTIMWSGDGYAWSNAISSTTENLLGITWNTLVNKFVVVGNNNTILESSDGNTWVNVAIFSTDVIDYNVQGDDFLYGYGPEELVPGLVSDVVTMIVTSKPGTTWNAQQYENVGYKVVSAEIASTGQTVYSFDNLVQTPAQLSVFAIDSTELSTTLYDTNDYTVDWHAKTVTLLSALVVGDTLRIDVYEPGNGDQLVKSNTDQHPIVVNQVTGFDEISLNCNYVALSYLGSGIIKQGQPIETVATLTDPISNSITCASVVGFTVNSPITFGGVTFGNIIDGDTYYVKTISTATSRITLSETLNSSGVAGTAFIVTSGTGSMNVFISLQADSLWTPSLVYYNGTLMAWGDVTTVTRTYSAGTINCSGTTNFVVGDTVVFSDTMFGMSINRQQVYYIANILSAYTFNISETLGGPVMTLDNARGSASVINRDYAFTPAPTGEHAVMVLAGKYDPSSNTDIVATSILVGQQYVITAVNNTDFTLIGATSNTIGEIFTATALGSGIGTVINNDYIFYTVFGETDVVQYGYTIPTVETFTGAGTTYTLSNYVQGDNAANAIVEKNGLRLIPGTDYTINTATNTLTLAVAALGGTVSVLSYNLTDRQYLNTQYMTGKTSSSIAQIYNNVLTVSVTNEVNYTTAAGNVITCDSTAGFTNNTIASYPHTPTDHLPVLFKVGATQYPVGSVGIGGIMVDGTVYYILTIDSETEYTISLTQTPGGTVVDLSDSLIAATNLVATIEYIIVTVGTTDWTLLGAASNTVGEIFVANATSTGTGDGVASTGFYVMNAVVGPSGVHPGATTNLPAVRAVTNSAHNLSENDIVYFTQILGSVELNNKPFYAHIVSTTEFDLYTTPYGMYSTSINTPVTAVSGYAGSGFVSVQYEFAMYDTTATKTIFTNETIIVASTSLLVQDTAVYFTGDVFGGIVAGKRYYIKTVDTSLSLITISETFDGPTFVPTDGTGTMYVTQMEQINVDRLWVTINGLRVPSSLLHLNPANDLAIYLEIAPTDKIIITSMMPTATPDQEVYLQNVDQHGVQEIYRANTMTNTWLTKTLKSDDTTISVFDANRLTDVVVQYVSTPDSISVHSIIVGQRYVIRNVGTTVFTSIGASANTSGTVFTATAVSTGTGSVSQVIVAGSMVTGQQYVITALGTTNFASFGASTNTIGVLFIATSAGTGTGTVRALNSTMSGSFVSGQLYVIISLGTTDFTLIGAASNTLGVTFMATGAGTGTGSANLKYIEVPLTANKNIITQLTVVNNTSGLAVPITAYTLAIVTMTPTLLFTSGVSPGDLLTITVVEGNMIYIDGEYINFTSCDLSTNTLSGLIRGDLGTGVHPEIPMYTTVYGVIPTNKLNPMRYNDTWNSYYYNPVEGDPLQISTTVTANFLNGNTT